jgi:hypothetical protein
LKLNQRQIYPKVIKICPQLSLAKLGFATPKAYLYITIHKFEALDEKGFNTEVVCFGEVLKADKFAPATAH